MGRRSLLIFATLAMGAVSLGATAYPLVQTLRPSARALDDSIVQLDLPELVSGVVYSLDVHGVPLLLLRPNEAQRAAITELDDKVWDSRSMAYHEALGAYAYWGLTRYRLVEEHHAEPLPWERAEMRWLGGYVESPWGGSSYDYAGRAIKEWRYTYDGFAYSHPVPNLRTPSVLAMEGGRLLVSIYQR